MTTTTTALEDARAAWRATTNQRAQAEQKALLDLEFATYALEDYADRVAIATLLESAHAMITAREAQLAAGDLLMAATDPDRKEVAS